MTTLLEEPPAPAPPPEPELTVVGHLTELRRRLVISVVAVVVAGALAFVFYEQILAVLLQPYRAATGKTTLFVTDPLEGFATRLKVAAYGGIVLASPVLLWQLWRFVTPGLHKRERRYAIPFVLSSMFLFCLGGGLAYYTLPRALEFLVEIGGDNLETLFSPAKYLGLIIFMIVAFGIAFEFPVVLVFLQLVGVLRSSRLRSWRRAAVVFIFVFVAVITPSSDPYSLIALAVPMYVFYEGSIVVGRVLGR